MPTATAKAPRLLRLVESSRGDRSGGVTLTVAAAAALAWANWPGSHSYTSVWYRVAPWSGPLGVSLSVQDWVNQGVLVAFFALVGLEIRREFAVGELRSLRRAMVPIVAAGGGMLTPALIFTAVVAGGRGAGAWGVPMATDVAFALGALALIGGVSARARVFLMTLAVADDIGSIVILVAFYSHHTDGVWLGGGILAVAALAALWALPGANAGRRTGWLRLLLAAVAWWAMLKAGVEAAVVGVALGAFGLRRRAPAGRAEAPAQVRPAVRAWVRRLEPAVNVVVLPVFALANVGVPLGGSWLSRPSAVRIFVAVVVARVIGKPLGIAASTLITVRFNPRAYQPRMVKRGLAGVGAVASIGFTVPLLIIRTALAPGPLTTAATAALLAGSLLGVAAGLAVLRPARRPAPERRGPPV